MAKVLVVSPNKVELDALKALLAREGIDTATALDGAGAAAGIEGKPGVVVLDVLTGFPGTAPLWKLVSTARKAGGFALLVLLSESDAAGPEMVMSSDDFSLRPYRAAELVARVKKLLKGSAETESRQVIRYGNLAIDPANYEVAVGGKRIDLTYKEYELLKFLAENKGKVFNRDTLLNRIWGYDYYGGDRTVDVHVRRLRSKIEDSSHTYIETVRNVGYRFAPSE